MLKRERLNCITMVAFCRWHWHIVRLYVDGASKPLRTHCEDTLLCVPRFYTIFVYQMIHTEKSVRSMNSIQCIQSKEKEGKKKSSIQLEQVFFFSRPSVLLIGNHFTDMPLTFSFYMYIFRIILFYVQ